jgi:hypothetical protein
MRLKLSFSRSVKLSNMVFTLEVMAFIFARLFI